MHKSIYLLAFLLPVPSFASFIFSGSFAQDDNMAEYQFTISSISTVTLQSFSYAGNGSTVPAGGFAPVLSVFGTIPSADPTLLGFDDGGTAPSACGTRLVDPVSNACLDADLVLTSLSPGTYLVVLTENDNTPNSPDLAAGFNEQGNGNFTGTNQGLSGESFLDPFGNQRTPNFYFTISGADSANTIPEPSAVSLFIAGLGIWAVKRKMRADEGR